MLYCWICLKSSKVLNSSLMVSEQFFVCNWCYKCLFVAKKRPLKHHHNELYFHIPKSFLFLSIFRYCLKKFVSKYLFRYCLKCLFLFFKQKKENYRSRFFWWIKKEEIQQWRQTRSRPGGKETLHIMLREIETWNQLKSIKNQSKIDQYI